MLRKELVKMQARLYSLWVEFSMNTVTNLRITWGGGAEIHLRAKRQITFREKHNPNVPVWQKFRTQLQEQFRRKLRIFCIKDVACRLNRNMPAFNDPDDKNFIKYLDKLFVSLFELEISFIHTCLCLYRIQVWQLQSIITYSSLNI